MSAESHRTHSAIYPQPLTGRTIRLLSIKPGDTDSPLHCTLTERRLDDDDSNPYYALSYCWGSGHIPVEITCNAQPLRITPNLHSALLEYRRRGPSTPLWVDAVCIDQSNVAERTSQVRMMQDVYATAARVVVWLGEAEATDGRALEVLRALHAPYATIRDQSGREIPLFTGQDDASHDASLAARVPDASFDALAAFLLRPWFSRIWIIQELICARALAIWCGSDTLNEDFPMLEAAARLMTMYNCNVKTQLATTALKDKAAEGIGRSKLMCAGRLWGFKSFRDRGMSGIMWFLLITRCFDATDPRDKVFALVGLASDVGEEFVDYSKSYEDVIQELSHMLLDGRIPTTSTSAVDAWSCITRDEDDDLSGPSWVVDWLKLKDSLYTPLMSQYESEHPTIYRQPEIRFSKDGEEETLHVRGTVFDTIAQIVPSPIAMRQLVPQSEFLTFQHLPGAYDWYAQAVATVAATNSNGDTVYQATGESLYEAFWRTLCCNRSAFNGTAPPVDDSSYAAWRRLLELQQERLTIETKYRRACQRQRRALCGLAALLVAALTYRFRRHRLLCVALPFTLPPLVQFIRQGYASGLQILLFGLLRNYLQQSTQTQIEQRDFENSHSQWTQGRQFGVTAQGLMGWVPLAARVGDSVGLFAGCRVPFVLRAVQGGWKVVGDAYVHGVMDGEGEGSEGEMLHIL